MRTIRTLIDVEDFVIKLKSLTLQGTKFDFADSTRGGLSKQGARTEIGFDQKEGVWFTHSFGEGWKDGGKKLFRGNYGVADYIWKHRKDINKTIRYLQKKWMNMSGAIWWK